MVMRKPYDILRPIKTNMKRMRHETNRDHIYYMIETAPTAVISDLVRNRKNYTTYPIGKLYRFILQKEFWNKHTFWSDGYFYCSIGNVSERMLNEYIENQG